MKKFTPQHKNFSGPIFSALFLEMIHERSPDLCAPYREMAATLGHPPLNSLYTVFSAAALESPQVYIPVVLQLFAEIPDYLLADFANVWIPRWIELQVSSATVDLFLKAGAKRGLIPYNKLGFTALSLHLQKPLQVVEYVKAVTKYFGGLNTNQRVPQLRQGFAVILARKLRSLPSHMHPDQVLEAFVKEVKRLRPPMNRKPIFGARFWQAANKFHHFSADEVQNACVPGTIEQCYEEINDLLAAWKEKPAHGVPQRVAQLYAKILERYAVYESNSVDAIYKQADATCNQLFGFRQSGNRRRRWLTSILGAFVRAEQYQKALQYVPQARQTKTPYIWGLAIIALARTAHTEQAWDWAETAIAHKDGEIPSKVAVELLESSMRQESAEKVRERLRRLLDWEFAFTEQQVAHVLHYAGTGACQYRWDDLREFIFLFSQELAARSEKLREQAGVSHWRRPHSVLGVPALTEIVRWGFVKRPLEPWCVVELLGELRSQNVALESGQVQRAVSLALAQLQGSDGEARRIRQQCPHSSSVISEQFAKRLESLY